MKKMSRQKEEITKKIAKRNALKLLRVTFGFYVVFSCIVYNLDALRHILPGIIYDKIYMQKDRQPLPGTYTSEIRSSIRNDSNKAPVLTGQRKKYTNLKTTSSTVVTPQRKPKTHVAFLKVHKAGSTTVQNLFFRFALKHKLNILIPKRGDYIYNHRNKVSLKRDEHFDIFACHTIYSKTWFDSLLPADSVRIGTVREPISRMISAAYFYRDVCGRKYLTNVPPANFIHNLINFPERHEKYFFSYTKNSMGKDFGFKKDIKQEDKIKLRTLLDKLNSEFLLVMVMEKLDESLILMKRALNWSIGDVLYFETNAHKHSPVVLNETEKAKFKQTSFLDFEIYEYFSTIFETKLKEAGHNFKQEVAFFRTVINRVGEFCSKTHEIGDEILVIQKSEWDCEFQVTTSDCEWMQTDGRHIIDKLRTSQLYAQGETRNTSV